MRFYELDPDVARIAESHFTYMKDSEAKIEVEIGDARISLMREALDETEPLLDILVLDAFSSDAIPLHLLTVEAFKVYLSRLEKKGILVAHISNRHVNLEPLIKGLAETIGKEALLVESSKNKEAMSYLTTSVIVTDNDEFIDRVRLSGHAEKWPEKFKTPLVFTDQYSNLFDLL